MNTKHHLQDCLAGAEQLAFFANLLRGTVECSEEQAIAFSAHVVRRLNELGRSAKDTAFQQFMTQSKAAARDTQDGAAS